ncbi:MAG: YkvA family protein [Rectinema subterraneum]|uniref:YkvA family protein n=1 Tax=Rectinema subterraneum TaxID=2653714 RepID=UPI003C7D8900
MKHPAHAEPAVPAALTPALKPVPPRPQRGMWLRRAKRRLRFRVSIVYYLAKSGQLPRSTKVLAALTIGYLVSPIDLIPDFIPVLGQLDDLLIVPLLVGLTLRSVPRPLVREAAKKAARTPVQLYKK